MWLSILYYAFCAVGIALIIVSVIKFRSTQTLLAEGNYTIAEVIDLQEYYDSDNDRMYKPLFEYTAESGEVKQYSSGMSSSHSPYDVGDQVEVVYDPNTDEMRTLTYFGLWGVVVILLGVGLAFFVVGGGYVVFRFF